MKGKPVVGIQPEVLKWARVSVGKTFADVARTLKRPTDEIEAWENGSKAPTYVQLEKLAYDVYKRPLAMFFFPDPPQESNPQSDFRTLPEEDLEELLPDTYLNIRRARLPSSASRIVRGRESNNEPYMAHHNSLGKRFRGAVRCSSA